MPVLFHKNIFLLNHQATHPQKFMRNRYLRTVFFSKSLTSGIGLESKQKQKGNLFYTTSKVFPTEPWSPAVFLCWYIICPSSYPVSSTGMGTLRESMSDGCLNYKWNSVTICLLDATKIQGIDIIYIFIYS